MTSNLSRCLLIQEEAPPSWIPETYFRNDDESSSTCDDPVMMMNLVQRMLDLCEVLVLYVEISYHVFEPWHSKLEGMLKCKEVILSAFDNLQIEYVCFGSIFQPISLLLLIYCFNGHPHLLLL